MALVTYDQLRPKYGITASRTTIARKMKMKPPKFPQSVRTSDSRIAWHDYEIEALLAGLERGNAVNHRAKKEAAAKS